jgi:hypothetical protein
MNETDVVVVTDVVYVRNVVSNGTKQSSDKRRRERIRISTSKTRRNHAIDCENKNVVLE